MTSRKADEEGSGQSDMEIRKKLTVRNNLGLHARAAAKIVDLVGQHRSRLFLTKDGQEVDGSSILSILTLACPKGAEIEARIVGDDCEVLMAALTQLVEQKFWETK
jgi:phosphocarrier protein